MLKSASWITLMVFAVVFAEDVPDNYKIYRVSEYPTLPEYLKDKDHGVKMGVASLVCDDGTTNIGVDWDGNAVNHTCDKKKFTPVDNTILPSEFCETKMPQKMASHICMAARIEYLEAIPTHGAHRPMWPSYGEYEFLPPQRWLHSLEHGGIVLLYDPCADPKEVDRLRQILIACLRRHIITPYKLLSAERPIALVGWGCRLEMNAVDEKLVKEFIKKSAKKGPESRVASDGAYRYRLTVPAKTVTDAKDHVICPNK